MKILLVQFLNIFENSFLVGNSYKIPNNKQTWSLDPKQFFCQYIKSFTTLHHQIMWTNFKFIIHCCHIRYKIYIQSWIYVIWQCLIMLFSNTKYCDNKNVSFFNNEQITHLIKASCIIIRNHTLSNNRK